jgi:hypothetical protein
MVKGLFGIPELMVHGHWGASQRPGGAICVERLLQTVGSSPCPIARVILGEDGGLDRSI